MNYRIINLNLDYNVIFKDGFDVDKWNLAGVKKSFEILKKNLNLKNKKAVIYGASTSGSIALKFLSDIEIIGYIDMSPAKKKFNGYPVFKPTEDVNYDFIFIAVSPSNYFSVMKCLRSSVAQNTLLIFMWKNEFFDPEILIEGQVIQQHSNISSKYSSYEGADNRGRIFFNGKYTFRALFENDLEFYKKILNCPRQLNDLIKNGLIKTEIADLTDKDNFILSHKSLLPSSPANWSMSMFLDAFAFFINFWEYLIVNGFSLQDNHSYNVMFDENNPVFVDFCSIGNFYATTLSPPFMKAFFKYWVFPAVLLECKQIDIFREFLERKINFEKIKPYLEDKHSKKLDILFEKCESKFNNKDLLGFIETVRVWLRKISVPQSSYGWNNEKYQATCLQKCTPIGKKEKIINDLICKYHPQTVLDLGCNKGRFSVLAEKSGAKVWALDTAETLIDALYLHSKKNNLKIFPRIWNIANLKPFSKPVFKFEMVLSLALMHHLVFTFGKKVNDFIGLLNQLSECIVVIEFIKIDASEPFVFNNYDPEIHNDYNEKYLKNELKKYFSNVSEIALGDTRKLFIGSKSVKI